MKTYKCLSQYCSDCNVFSLNDFSTHVKEQHCLSLNESLLETVKEDSGIDLSLSDKACKECGAVYDEMAGLMHHFIMEHTTKIEDTSTTFAPPKEGLVGNDTVYDGKVAKAYFKNAKLEI